MHKLVISDDEGKTTIVPLIRDEVTIGRKEGNTIRLTERNVSRRHARLIRSNGSFQIEDLGSYNGIRLNGIRISDRSVIKEGDQLQIGDYQLALQSDKAAARATQDAAPTTATRVTSEAATEMIAVPATDATTPMAVPVEPAPAVGRLVLLSAPAPGTEFTLDRDEILIGRAEECDASINHRSISREHAKILRVDNAYRILDLESANGVRVNGQDVPYAELRMGDLIELGHVRLRFVAPSEHYRFEGDATVQISTAQVHRPSRVPLWIGAVLLVAGLLVTYLAVQSDDGPGNQPRPSSPLPPLASGTSAEAQTQARASLELVAAHRAGQRYDQAIEAAQHAMRAHERAGLPTDQDMRLIADIGRERTAKEGEDAFQEFMRLAEREPLHAFSVLGRVPENSMHFGEPAAVDAVASVLRAKLEDARNLAHNRDVDGARAAVQAVLSDPRLRGGGRGVLGQVRSEAEAQQRRMQRTEVRATPPPGQSQARRLPVGGGTQQTGRQTPPTPANGSNDQQCPVAITSASAAQCFLNATGGRGPIIRTILAYTFVDPRRANTLACQYLDAHPEATPSLRGQLTQFCRR